MSEDYHERGANQISSRQESGTATIDDPSVSQTVAVTFDTPFPTAPDVVGLAADDTNSVHYSSLSKTGFTINTAKSTAGAVDVGWVVTGED